MSFKVGDKVRVNGQSMTITSWPSEDGGPFTATMQTPDGRGGFSETYGTFWVGASSNVEADETLPTPDIELVTEGSGVVESTAGDVTGLEPAAEHVGEHEADEPEPAQAE